MVASKRVLIAVLDEKGQPAVCVSLCESLEGDKIMRSLIRSSLSMLCSVIPNTIIKDIQFAGSLTTGEATVIEKESEIICSDLDVIVSVGLPHYIILKMKRIFPKLAAHINSNFSMKGLRTHVNISLTSRFLSLIPRSLKRSRIYSYEFANNISIKKKKSSEAKTPRIYPPTKTDALQLIFTMCADYVFLDSMFECPTEKIYWLAKRYLTLIYAMLIFEGSPSRSYKRRLYLALRSPTIAKLFSIQGLNYLEDFTEEDSVLDKLKTLSATQVKIVLSYQMSRSLRQGEICQQWWVRNAPNDHALLNVLKRYFAENSKSTVSSLVYTFFFSLFSILTGRAHLIPFAARLFSLRHSLRVTSNYLVGLLFLHRTGVVESKPHFDNVLGELHLRERDVRSVWRMAEEIGYS